MRITPAPICSDCGREGHHLAASCARCAGKMVPVSATQFYAALTVAAISRGGHSGRVAFTTFGGSQYEEEMYGADGYLGLAVVGFAFAVILCALAYGGVCAIIGYVLMGLLKGALWGLEWCTASSLGWCWARLEGSWV